MDFREEHLFLFWGKYRPADTEGRAAYHPAVAHMVDVGAVAEVMMRSWAEPLASLLGVSEALAGRWGALLIAAHDVGKLHAGFQQKINDPDRIRPAQEAGLPLIVPKRLGELTRDFDHGCQTVLALSEWLGKQPGIAGDPETPVAEVLARAVGAHHGRFHTSLRIHKHCGVYGRYDRLGWAVLQDRALDWLAEQFLGPVAGQPLRLDPANLSAAAIALAGLTSICDWVGSSAEDFPPTGDSIGPREYPASARARAVAAVEKRRLIVPERLREIFPPGGGSPGSASFARLFPEKLPPRPIQDAVIEAVSRAGGRTGLLLLEAPMGEGKTEAALWWAAASQSDKCRGVYIALPTQATSDAMHPRLRRALEAIDPQGDPPEVHLVHGASIPELERASASMTPNTPDGQDRGEALEAESWFAPRKRALWATYAVGTIDQALLSALAVKHGFVRLAGLASKAVVIDEVHAYDVYMSSLLERLLRWLAELGTPVALLSATLPARRRAALLAAYCGQSVPDGPCSYPVVALAGRDGSIEWIEPPPSGRNREVAVEQRRDPGLDPDGLRRLAAELLASVADGGCVAWLQSTVDGAQMAFEALRSLRASRVGPDVELELLHARRRLMDRQRAERAVLDRFGPGGNRPRRAIVVATQVLEQSLDLDFDLMVSPLAPIDLLLQRLGRLHRHAETCRPAAMDKPRLILLGPPTPADGRPDFGPTGRIYDRFVLLKSLMTLANRGTIRLPEDIRGLVEAVYDDRVPGPDEAAAAGIDPADLSDSWRLLAQQRTSDCHEARLRLLPEPDARSPFYRGADVPFEDQEEDAPSDRWIAAVTRLGPPRRRVIVLHRRQGRLYLDAEGGEPLDLSRRPPPNLQRELLLRALSVSRFELIEHLKTFEPPAGLRDCAPLRHHAVLELEHGRYAVPGTPLVVRLDDSLGLVYERPAGDL